MLKPPSRYGLPIGGLCIPWNHGKTLAADFLLRSSRNMVSCLGEGYHMVPSWRISWSCVWWSLIITLLSLCYTLSRFISIYDNKRLRYSTDDIYIYIYNIILYLSKVWPGKWCTLWTLSSPINNMSIWNLAKWNQLWCARVVTNLWVRLLQASTHVWSSMGGKKSEMLRNHQSWGNVQFFLVWNMDIGDISRGKR